MDGEEVEVAWAAAGMLELVVWDGAIARDVSRRVMLEVLGVSCFAVGLLVFFFDTPIARPAPSPAVRRATMVTIRIHKMKGLIPQNSSLVRFLALRVGYLLFGLRFVPGIGLGIRRCNNFEAEASLWTSGWVLWMYSLTLSFDELMKYLSSPFLPRTLVYPLSNGFLYGNPSIQSQDSDDE